MKKAKHGNTIVPKDVFPEKHKLSTALFLSDMGKDVEFLVPVDKNHIKAPDMKMTEGILKKKMILQRVNKKNEAFFKITIVKDIIFIPYESFDPNYYEIFCQLSAILSGYAELPV